MKGPAPFRVYKAGDVWILHRRALPLLTIAGFATAGQAIDHAYRNWPWTP